MVLDPYSLAKPSPYTLQSGSEDASITPEFSSASGQIQLYKNYTREKTLRLLPSG